MIQKFFQWIVYPPHTVARHMIHSMYTNTSKFTTKLINYQPLDKVNNELLTALFNLPISAPKNPTHFLEWQLSCRHMRQVVSTNVFSQAPAPCRDNCCTAHQCKPQTTRGCTQLLLIIRNCHSTTIYRYTNAIM